MIRSCAIKTLRAALLVLCAGTAAGPCAAQNYPTKPIRFIVPFPPGGQTDALARIVGKQLTDRWGQQVIVDNRPGGNTIIGAEIAAKAPADGYTLLLAIDSTLTMNQSLYRKLPYNPDKDFIPVIQAVTLPLALISHPSLPAKSLADVVTMAKNEPSRLNYGAGTITTQLAGELFKSLAGIEITYVPYKGSAPTVQGLLSNDVHMIFDGISTALPYINTGKLRAIAVTGSKRSPLLPDVPTMAEAGIAGYKVDVWLGVVAPRGTPQEIVDKLNNAINDILQAPETMEKVSALGMESVGGSTEKFKATIKSDTVKWTKTVKEAGIHLD